MAQARSRAASWVIFVSGLVVCVVVLFAASVSPAYAVDVELSGRVSLDYVPRWLDGTEIGDQDLYLSVLLDCRDPMDRFSGSLYWRGVKDIDGVSGSMNSRFRSVYDAYGDEWFGQLFYAYADVKSDGPLSRARIGRQFLYQGQPFHFDGLRLQTREGPKGIRVLGFAGIPVHYFEESGGENWLVGLGAEMRPWKGGKLTALLAHVQDDARFVGLPETSEIDNLLILSAGSMLGDWGSALVRFTGVDAEARDVLLRARASLRQIDTNVSLSCYAQTMTLEESTIDFSAYNLVQGVSHPYAKVDFSASKGFKLSSGWRVSAEGRGAARRLFDPGDEGEYNRNYDLLWLGVGFEAPERRKFSANIGLAWWWSTLTAGDDIRALDAELRWQPVEGLRIGFGSSYSLYRYDVFSLSEQTDVRETFIKVLWKPAEHIEFKGRYAAEQYDGDLIHKMGLGCSVKF